MSITVPLEQRFTAWAHSTTQLVGGTCTEIVRNPAEVDSGHPGSGCSLSWVEAQMEAGAASQANRHIQLTRMPGGRNVPNKDS